MRIVEFYERKFAPFAERPERAGGGRRGGRPCVSGRGRARARTHRAARNTRARVRARVRACARARLADATRGLVKLAPDVACAKRRDRHAVLLSRKARENWSAGAASGIDGRASAGDVASDSGRTRTVREVWVVRVALDPRLRTARARDSLRHAFSTLSVQTSTRKKYLSRHVISLEIWKKALFLKGREAHHPGLEISCRSATREQSLVFVYRLIRDNFTGKRRVDHQPPKFSIHVFCGRESSWVRGLFQAAAEFHARCRRASF